MEAKNKIFTDEGVSRFLEFLTRIKDETYPEYPMEVHEKISNQVIDKIVKELRLPAYSKILDVGCGQGLALKRFTDYGLSPIGITLNETDLKVCKKNGYEVYMMDQSFLRFGDSEFDLLWARHVLEHSVFPFYTLHEYKRVLKKNAVLYVEVPGAETDAVHELNKNHYSVLTKTMWKALFERAGFTIILDASIELELLQGGNDIYWPFLLKK